MEVPAAVKVVSIQVVLSTVEKVKGAFTTQSYRREPLPKKLYQTYLPN
jgi:hypothetical protein